MSDRPNPENQLAQTAQLGRVLITGAAGFIGSWLLEAVLDRAETVVALVRDEDVRILTEGREMPRRPSIVRGAVEEIAAVERAIAEYEVDTVFHLAAQSLVRVGHRSPLETFESNIRGTYTLLEACRRHSDLVQRLVVASSDKAYGTSATEPYTEQTALAGRQPYEASKTCADVLAQTYHAAYGLPVAIVRCGNVYGGGDLNWDRLIPGTIRSLWRGERPVIRSDGTYVRDFLHVRDAVDAYLAVAGSLPMKAGEAFNFSAEQPATVLEVVARLQEIQGRTDLVPDVRNEAGAEIRDQRVSASKAGDQLGWKAAVGLDEGLKESVAWYVDYLDRRYGVRSPA